MNCSHLKLYVNIYGNVLCQNCPNIWLPSDKSGERVECRFGNLHCDDVSANRPWTCINKWCMCSEIIPDGEPLKSRHHKPPESGERERWEKIGRLMYENNMANYTLEEMKALTDAAPCPFFGCDCKPKPPAAPVQEEGHCPCKLCSKHKPLNAGDYYTKADIDERFRALLDFQLWLDTKYEASNFLSKLDALRKKYL